METTMNEKNLEIIKDRTLVLKAHERSNEIVLVDPDGGNMFLTFELRYIGENDSGSTTIKPLDLHHVEVVIETRPDAITKPSMLIELGTYADTRPLFLGFVVQPQLANSGEHNVIVTFYAGKEVVNG